MSHTSQINLAGPQTLYPTTTYTVSTSAYYAMFDTTLGNITSYMPSCSIVQASTSQTTAYLLNDVGLASVNILKTGLGSSITNNSPITYTGTGANTITTTGVDYTLCVPKTDGCASGRLGIVQGQPFTEPNVTNVTAASLLYYTPVLGNVVSLYNNSTWANYPFTEQSISFSNGFGSQRPYDVFMYYNGTSPALDSTAWSSTTARSTSLTGQDGVYIKNGDATRRYLGSVIVQSNNTVWDTPSYRHIYNYDLQNKITRYITVPFSSPFPSGTTLGLQVTSQPIFNNSKFNISLLQGDPQLLRTEIHLDSIVAAIQPATNLQYYLQAPVVNGTTFSNVYPDSFMQGQTRPRAVESTYDGYQQILGLGLNTITWVEGTNYTAAQCYVYGPNATSAGSTSFSVGPACQGYVKI